MFNRRRLLRAIKLPWSNQSGRGIWWIPERGEAILRDHSGIPQQNPNHTGETMSSVSFAAADCGFSGDYNHFCLVCRLRSSWTSCCTISTSLRRPAYCRAPPTRRSSAPCTTARARAASRRYASMASTEASVERMVRWLSLSCLHQVLSHLLMFWFLHAATVYGQGVYFAVNSALSVQDQYSPPNADGYKFIFVSKVLTGDYTKGCHSIKTAPLKETGDIPLRYDSVTDNITKPSMFVIFNDTQAFPEYLITCQRIHRWGEWIRRRRWNLERADCWCFNVSAFSLKNQFWFIKG